MVNLWISHVTNNALYVTHENTMIIPWVSMGGVDQADHEWVACGPIYSLKRASRVSNVA